MEITIDLTKILPADVDLLNTLFFAGMFCLGVILVSLVARLILGKNSSLNQAISAALGILLIYAVTVVIYTFNPRDLARYLSPLPYVSLLEDKLVLFSFAASEVPELCHQVLSMIVLAFLVNLIANYIPEKPPRILGWMMYRALGVLGAMVLHYFTHQLIDYFIPGFLEGYAPMILLCILLFMLSLGVLKCVLGLVLTAVNPIFGALYAFFFSHKIGKQVSKAVLSTAIITGLFLALEYLGYNVIPISTEALVSYVPFAVIMLLAWFLLGVIL